MGKESTNKIKIMVASTVYNFEDQLNDIVSELTTINLESGSVSGSVNFTVARYVKKLKEKGAIEYVGSDKTGGYKIVQQPDITTLNS
jgi:hypothetical protein